ncbi:MAG: hypothetical protein IKK83_04435 [Clostridia bacterium]|nr:hypothetical protein [Clostridia bacterium]
MYPKFNSGVKNVFLWLILAAIIVFTGVYLIKEAELSGSAALQVFGGFGNTPSRNTAFLDLLR